jgi:hypothetical protein
MKQKYAKIIDGRVDSISFEANTLSDGFIEVADNVFGDMVLQEDGSYDYTDEFKAEHQRPETYSDKREKEYPTWEDQLDDIYHNGIDGWKATIKVTKDKYPKP